MFRSMYSRPVLPSSSLFPRVLYYFLDGRQLAANCGHGSVDLTLVETPEMVLLARKREEEEEEEEN